MAEVKVDKVDTDKEKVDKDKEKVDKDKEKVDKDCCQVCKHIPEKPKTPAPGTPAPGAAAAADVPATDAFGPPPPPPPPPPTKEKKKRERKKFQKEMWNWDWKKLRAMAKGGKEEDAADKEIEIETQEVGEVELKYQYPLIAMSEIPKQFESEMMDTIMSAIDRFTSDLPKACEYVKKEFDRLYEPMWHCIIGSNFGFDVTYDQNSIMYMFYNGNMAILVWKLVTF